MEQDTLPPHLQGEEIAEQPDVENDVEEEQTILTSLHLSGVDDLSTEQIKEYLEQHIRPKNSFATHEKYSYMDFRLKWINDHEINVVFDYNENKEAKQRYEAERQQNRKLTREEKSKQPDLLDELKALDGETPETEGDTNGETQNEMEVDENTNDNNNDDKGDDMESQIGNESIRGAADAILLLTNFENICREHQEFSELPIEDQFAAVTQAPKLQDRQCWDLVLDKDGKVVKTEEAKSFYKVFEKTVLGIEEQEQETSDEDAEIKLDAIEPVEEQKESEMQSLDLSDESNKIIKLEVRYSTPKDRKVKDAKNYSRYYLLHGEPEDTSRLPPARENTAPIKQARYQKDLITGQGVETTGVFGYAHDNDRDAYSNDPRSYRDQRRWDNDLYNDSYRNRMDSRDYRDYRDHRDNRYRGDRYRDDRYRDDRYRNDRYGDDRRSGEWRGFRGPERRPGGIYKERRGGRGGGRGRGRGGNRGGNLSRDLPDLFPDFGN